MMGPIGVANYRQGDDWQPRARAGIIKRPSRWAYVT
jgi:hypothetical protein